MIKAATNIHKVWAISFAPRIFGTEINCAPSKYITIRKGKSTLSGLYGGQTHLQISSKLETRQVCSDTKIFSVNGTPETPANENNTTPADLNYERSRIISEIFGQDPKYLINDAIGNMGHINVGLIAIDQFNMDDMNDERSVDELFVSDFIGDHYPPEKQEIKMCKDDFTIYKDNYRTSLWFESVLMDNPDAIGDKCGICDDPEIICDYDMSDTTHGALDLSYVIHDNTDEPLDEANDKLAAPSEKHALVATNIVTNNFAVVPVEENRTKVEIPQKTLVNIEMLENVQVSENTQMFEYSAFMSTSDVPYWNSLFETACGEDYHDRVSNLSQNVPNVDPNLHLVTEWLKNKKEPRGTLFKRYKSGVVLVEDHFKGNDDTISASTFAAKATTESSESKEADDNDIEATNVVDTPTTEATDESSSLNSEEFLDIGFQTISGELTLAKDNKNTVDEVAKRCLNSASNECIDTILLKEMEKSQNTSKFNDRKNR